MKDVKSNNMMNKKIKKMIKNMILLEESSDLDTFLDKADEDFKYKAFIEKSCKNGFGYNDTKKYSIEKITEEVINELKKMI